MFVVECDPETILINSLTSVSKKKIEHASGKSRVIQKLLRNYKNSIGLIDEDPWSTQPPDIQKFQETKNLEKHKIKILSHQGRNNQLIILCPRLEEWIIEASKEANIDINKKYKLPNDPIELHKIINVKTENFRQLIEELMQKSPRLKALRNHIKNRRKYAAGRT